MHTAMAVPSLRTKDELRVEALLARRTYAGALAPPLRDELERALADIVSPRIADGAIVAGYVPMRDEIDPTPLLRALSARGCVLTYPWFADRAAPMTFGAGFGMEVGPWGASQPSPPVATRQPEVVLVPLVAVDRAGNRIGQGQGHYDRALADLRTRGDVRTVGLGWDVQLLDGAVPVDPWDVPLDAVATPTRWIETRKIERTQP